VDLAGLILVAVMVIVFGAVNVPTELILFVLQLDLPSFGQLTVVDIANFEMIGNGARQGRSQWKI